MDDSTTQILDRLNTVGGAAWRIAVEGTIRAGWLQACGGGTALLLGLILGLIAWLQSRKGYEGEGAAILFGVVGAVFGVAGFIILCFGIANLVNPEFEALTALTGCRR